MAETLTLSDFLVARIDEQEAAYRKALGYCLSVDDHRTAKLLGLALRDCEAKRRIVALHDNRCPDCGAGRRCIPHDVSAGAPSVNYRDPVDVLTLHILAAAHADHAHFRQEWAGR